MALDGNPWFKKSDIGSGVILASILGIVAFAWEWYKASPILATFKEFWIFAGGAFSNITNYQIKLWWLVAVGLLLKLTLLGYKRYLRRQNVSKTFNEDLYVSDEDFDRMHEEMDREADEAKAKENRMLGYTADKFLNITWEWRWIFNKKIKQYEVKYLLPCCPDPDCELQSMTYAHRKDSLDFYWCPCCMETFGVQNKGNSAFRQVEQEIIKKVATF